MITPQFLNRLKEGSFEMAVAAAGCELEMSAIDFYSKAANDCPGEEPAAVFRFLAIWERGHLESGSELQDRMQGQRLAERGFSPM